MKELTAVKFRIILYVAMFIVAAATIGGFFFGYNYLKTVGEDTLKRQADAVASEDSISTLQATQAELEKKADVTEKLNSLRSSNTLPQFDTEKSLRTIARQLGLQVRNITFVDGGSTGTTSGTPAASSGTPAASEGATAAPTTGGGSWSGTRNSKISFEFAGNISYEDLIRFLDAIETSTPKLRVDGVNLPSGSSRGSINVGTLTLEMATM